MSVPHKHAEVIKAWADGRIVQERVMRCGEWQVWKDVVSHAPTFWTDSCYEFRIKPQPVPDRTIYTYVQKTTAYSAQILITGDKDWNENNKPSYTAPCNLVLVFDGETNQLKDAKVVK
jgi:hypothetical protein